jgi:methionyl-tRNA synthetase
MEYIKGRKMYINMGYLRTRRKARVLAERKKVYFSCSKISTSMQKTLGCLNLIHNSCIETANISHINFVTEAINYLAQKGDVYRGNYNGCFCEQCDAYILDTDIIEGNRCPIHKTPLREQNEPCYFLRLSKYQDAIQDYIKGLRICL